jgi:hypothetical protein
MSRGPETPAIANRLARTPGVFNLKEPLDAADVGPVETGPSQVLRAVVVDARRHAKAVQFYFVLRP